MLTSTRRIWHTPRAGLLSATLVPVAAGWAILYGQHVAAYSALSWLSRAGRQSNDLSTDMARAAAEALLASGATLWAGEERLHAIGVWPETNASMEPTTIDVLQHGYAHVNHAGATEKKMELGLQRPADDFFVSGIEAFNVADLENGAIRVGKLDEFRRLFEIDGERLYEKARRGDDVELRLRNN